MMLLILRKCRAALILLWLRKGEDCPWSRKTSHSADSIIESADCTNVGFVLLLLLLHEVAIVMLGAIIMYEQLPPSYQPMLRGNESHVIRHKWPRRYLRYG